MTPQEIEALKAERDYLSERVIEIKDYCQENNIGALGASSISALIAHCNSLSNEIAYLKQNSKCERADAIEAAANTLRIALVDGGPRWAVRHSDLLEYAESLRQGGAE